MKKEYDFFQTERTEESVPRQEKSRGTNLSVQVFNYFKKVPMKQAE
jgi:hypothetical protein